MSQDALGLLKHLKTARARWPFPDEVQVGRVQFPGVVYNSCSRNPYGGD